MHTSSLPGAVNGEQWEDRGSPWHLNWACNPSLQGDSRVGGEGYRAWHGSCLGVFTALTLRTTQATKRTAVIPESYPSKRSIHLLLPSACGKLLSRSWKLAHSKGARPTLWTSRGASKSQDRLWSWSLRHNTDLGRSVRRVAPLKIRSRWQSLSWRGRAWAHKQHLSTKSKAFKNTTSLPLPLSREHRWSHRYIGAPNLYKQSKTCTCCQETVSWGWGLRQHMATIGLAASAPMPGVPVPRHHPSFFTSQSRAKALQGFWGRVGEGHGPSCLQLVCPLVWKGRGRWNEGIMRMNWPWSPQ